MELALPTLSLEAQLVLDFRLAALANERFSLVLLAIVALHILSGLDWYRFKHVLCPNSNGLPSRAHLKHDKMPTWASSGPEFQLVKQFLDLPTLARLRTVCGDFCAQVSDDDLGLFVRLQALDHLGTHARAQDAGLDGGSLKDLVKSAAWLGCTHLDSLPALTDEHRKRLTSLSPRIIARKFRVASTLHLGSVYSLWLFEALTRGSLGLTRTSVAIEICAYFGLAYGLYYKWPEWPLAFAPRYVTAVLKFHTLIAEPGLCLATSAYAFSSNSVAFWSKLTGILMVFALGELVRDPKIALVFFVDHVEPGELNENVNRRAVGDCIVLCLAAQCGLSWFFYYLALVLGSESLRQLWFCSHRLECCDPRLEGRLRWAVLLAVGSMAFGLLSAVEKG